MSSFWISSIVFAPIAGALLLGVFKVIVGKKVGTWTTLAIALAASLFSSVSAFIWVASKSWVDPSAITVFDWLPEFSLRFEMGGDGITALFSLLLSIIFPCTLLTEWKRTQGKSGVLFTHLLFQFAILGALFSQNLFMIVFFWSITALPLYFLVSIWGEDGRERVSFRSFIFASIGNALVFSAILLLYFADEHHSFSFSALMSVHKGQYSLDLFGRSISLITTAFCLMSAGFFLRLPLVPFHFWISGFTKSAPPSGLSAYFGAFVPVSFLLFTKLVYGLFPEQAKEAAGFFLAISLINLIYGALGTLGKTSSRAALSRFSFVLSGVVFIGLASANVDAISGILLANASFALVFTGLAFFIGSLQERGIPESMKNIIEQAPSLSLMGAVILAALMGFPGTSTFVGLAVTTFGCHANYPVATGVLFFSLIFVVAGAVGLLRAIFFRAKEKGSEPISDATWIEKAAMIPICILVLGLGVYPKPAFDLIEKTAEQWVEWLK